MEKAFLKYGEVDKVHIDISKGTYAIVEFMDEKSAEFALREGSISVGKVWDDFSLKPFFVKECFIGRSFLSTWLL